MTRPRKQFPDQLAPGMAHEIGNFLGALSLRLQILQQNPACRKAQGRNLDAMARILEQANDLVQRVQVLSMRTPLPRSTSAEPLRLPRAAPKPRRSRSAARQHRGD